MKVIISLLILFLFYDQIIAKYLVENIADLNGFKKLCKSRKNILIFFNNVNSENDKRDEYLTILTEAAALVEGEATIGAVDCLTKEGKKFCKTLKGLPEFDQPFRLRHYKGCDFNKEYERQFNAKTIQRFLSNPDGETPWADETNSQNVMHFERADDFLQHIKTSKLPTFAMFYAPWCGHCKALKPAYTEVANEMHDKVIIAAVDMTMHNNKALEKHYKIPGYPTLIYLEKEKQVPFSGQRNKEGIIKWLIESEKIAEKPWSETPNDIAHLSDDNFDAFIKDNPSVLVMFYAPWCGHCKEAKPVFEKAATGLKARKVEGIFAAIDMTINKETKEKYQINSYPAFKYFKDGKFAWNTNIRKETDLIEFMLDPKQPEVSNVWLGKDSKVVHLTDTDAEEKLKEFTHALVMYHSPECSLCQTIKPHYMLAAKDLAGESDVMLAAIDCGSERQICNTHNAQIYPAIVYFKKGKKERTFSGQATTDNFLEFIRKEMGIPKEENELNTTPLEFVPQVKQVTPKNFEEIVSKGRQIVMFCVPWSKKCKQILHIFNDVASLVTENSMIAFDCTNVQTYCIDKDAMLYPTFQIFENGKYLKSFEAKTIEDFVSALSGKAPIPKLEFEPEVKIGTHWNIDELIASNDRSLVLFYAPWCGHCKAIKPEFGKAAKQMKKANFIAIDCTRFQGACAKFAVTSYPTLKTFVAGQFIGNYKGERTAKGFLKSFNANASDELTSHDFGFSAAVKVAKEETFKDIVSNGKNLVFFYAPWCGYCKKSKSDYNEAAETDKEGNYVAVDCTSNQSLCKLYGIRGYPSLKFFENGKMIQSYKGDRKAKDFIEALKNFKSEEKPLKEEL